MSSLTAHLSATPRQCEETAAWTGARLFAPSGALARSQTRPDEVGSTTSASGRLCYCAGEILTIETGLSNWLVTKAYSPLSLSHDERLDLLADALSEHSEREPGSANRI
jgi:hypothetical protein